MERIPCSPCQIVADVASLMRVRADAKGLSFNVEYCGAIPETVETDPTRLRQVLINVIGNAVKFTEVGSVQLLVSLVDKQADPKLQFDIVDTGLGMRPEQVTRLFEPFSQADTSTTREFGGTGLGLAISRRLANGLGGNITVAETIVGRGTRFRITIATGPLEGVNILADPLSATSVTAPEDTTPRRTEATLENYQILLAEDGPDNQRLIAHFLKMAGAGVAVVENGQLAVDAAMTATVSDKPFDVILMDMQMPVMDGYEATRELRRRGYSGTIIALTAHAMASDRAKCIEAGCDDYVSKPVNRQRLVAVIHACSPLAAAR
jgi:CheY-like chemotaxis protein